MDLLNLNWFFNQISQDNQPIELHDCILEELALRNHIHNDDYLPEKFFHYPELKGKHPTTILNLFNKDTSIFLDKIIGEVLTRYQNGTLLSKKQTSQLNQLKAYGAVQGLTARLAICNAQFNKMGWLLSIGLQCNPNYCEQVNEQIWWDMITIFINNPMHNDRWRSEQQFALSIMINQSINDDNDDNHIVQQLKDIVSHAHEDTSCSIHNIASTDFNKMFDKIKLTPLSDEQWNNVSQAFTDMLAHSAKHNPLLLLKYFGNFSHPNDTPYADTLVAHFVFPSYFLQQHIHRNYSTVISPKDGEQEWFDDNLVQFKDVKVHQNNQTFNKSIILNGKTIPASHSISFDIDMTIIPNNDVLPELILGRSTHKGKTTQTTALPNDLIINPEYQRVRYLLQIPNGIHVVGKLTLLAQPSGELAIHMEHDTPFKTARVYTYENVFDNGVCHIAYWLNQATMFNRAVVRWEQVDKATWSDVQTLCNLLFSVHMDGVLSLYTGAMRLRGLEFKGAFNIDGEFSKHCIGSKWFDGLPIAVRCHTNRAAPLLRPLPLSVVPFHLLDNSDGSWELLDCKISVDNVYVGNERGIVKPKRHLIIDIHKPNDNLRQTFELLHELWCTTDYHS